MIRLEKSFPISNDDGTTLAGSINGCLAFINLMNLLSLISGVVQCRFKE